MPWPGDLRLFETTRDRDESLTLCRWHEAQVRWLACDADEVTLSRMRAHFERVYGRVDLRPSPTPNPIRLG